MADKRLLGTESWLMDMRYNIRIYDSSNNLIRGVSQWDIDREIKIKGLDIESAPIIRVWNANSETAIVLAATINDGYVVFTLPNDLLKTAIDIRASVVVKNDDEYMTICRLTIPVAAQMKPENYDDILPSDNNGGE